MDTTQILKVICLVISVIGMCIGGYHLKLHIQSNEPKELIKRKKYISLSYSIISFGFVGYLLIMK